MKICPVGDNLFHVDGQTDMKKIIFAFRNSVIVPEKKIVAWQISTIVLCRHIRARSEPGGTRWRTSGEVKGKLANGVGSQYSHATSERGISSITQADAHTSTASSRLNWRSHRFKWTRTFREKTNFGFYACAITFRTSYTLVPKIHIALTSAAI